MKEIEKSGFNPSPDLKSEIEKLFNKFMEEFIDYSIDNGDSLRSIICSSIVELNRVFSSHHKSTYSITINEFVLNLRTLLYLDLVMIFNFCKHKDRYGEILDDFFNIIKEDVLSLIEVNNEEKS